MRKSGQRSAIEFLVVSAVVPSCWNHTSASYAEPHWYLLFALRDKQIFWSEIMHVPFSSKKYGGMAPNFAKAMVSHVTGD